MKRILLLSIFILFVTSLTLSAQEEKRYVRQGNKHFEKERYTEAEVEYLRALTADSSSISAAFNLGSTFYRQNRHEDVQRILKQVVTNADSLSMESANASYNLANSFLTERKLQEAIESYKASLRINPTDTLAKKNLAYAQKLLEDQQNDQDNQDQNNDQNQDNQDQNQDNQDQNQDNQDQGEDNKDQDQDNQDQDQNQDNQDQNSDQNQNNNNQDQQQSGGSDMSRSQAEQLLDAIQKSEDKTQEKVNDEKAVGIAGKSGKNW